MLRTGRVLGAFALVAAVAAMPGCGSDDDNPAGPAGPGGSSSSSSSASTGGGGGQGGDGGSLTCPAEEGVTLALTKIDFGPGNSGQWKKVGLNIDGLTSTGSSTDVCTPNAEAEPFTAFPDGDNGIDNSFGKNLVPLILSLRPEWATDLNNDLEAGDFNALMKMYCLPDTGDVSNMTTKVFGGGKLGYPPEFDGTDAWPVAPELLADTSDPESSTITFANSTVTGASFDSGKNQTFIFTLPMFFDGKATTIKLALYAAQVQMELSADRKSATGGVIAGVLDTEEFVDQAKRIGWLAGMCGETIFDNVLAQVRQASDILIDGTQDPTKMCNGISIGIHFEMKEVQIGDVGPVAPKGEACP
jgi:hypothetical protein